MVARVKAGFAAGVVLAGAMALGMAMPARAQLVLSVNVAPPALPVYAQPICPGEGYMWTPGYWAYGPDGYFWVPGTWVRPPRIGYLWTPAWWGWDAGRYLFHPGYWGPHIGYYGGINYGFGYGGVGYEGGYWRGNAFVYNRTVNHLGDGFRNVYERPVPLRNAAYNHVSFNGGNGGVPYRPSASEEVAARERHFAPTGEQIQHQGFAARSPQQFAAANRGRPPVTAASTPSAFRASPNTPSAQQGVFGPRNAMARGGYNGQAVAPAQRGGFGQREPGVVGQAQRGGFGPPSGARPQFYGQGRSNAFQQQRQFAPQQGLRPMMQGRGRMPMGEPGMRQAPQMQRPMMPGPRMQAPQQMQRPMTQGPRMQAPQMARPMMQAPRMQGPQMRGGPAGGGRPGHR